MSVELRPLRFFNREDDLAGIADHLESAVAGSYLRNHCLIRLGRDTSFWNTENEPTLHRLSVFMHEYLHFVHNFSTVVGLYDFFAQLRFARLFCNTVGAAGGSMGIEVLEPEARREVANVTTWRRHLRGGGGAAVVSALKQARIHPRFVGSRSNYHTVQIGSQEIGCHGVTVEFDGAALGRAEPFEIALGCDVLMEGCALEAECQLFEKYGAAADDVRRAVPSYPYQTARVIFEGIVGSPPSSWFLCRICVLALQSTDPGNAFIQICQACKRAGPGADEKLLVGQFLENSDAFFRVAVTKILEDSLIREVQPFAGRGHAGRGLQRMVSWAEDLFKARLQNRFFEFVAFEAAPDLEPLVVLLRSMPTCPIVQEIDPSTHESELIFFSDQEVTVDLAQEIGAAQSLLHFADSHLTVEGYIVQTSGAGRRPCIFAGACRAPLAMENSLTCFETPWKSFVASDALGCWYAQGVKASRGRPDL